MGNKYTPEQKQFYSALKAGQRTRSGIVKWGRGIDRGVNQLTRGVGGIVGGAVCGIFSIIGSMVATSLESSKAKTCLQCGGTAEEQYSNGNATGYKCPNCKRFWVKHH